MPPTAKARKRPPLLFFYGLLFTFLTYTVVAAAPMWPSHPVAAGLLGAGVFVLMMAWQFVYRSNQTRADRRWFRVLATAGSVTMGFWATFVLLSLPVAFFRIFFIAAERLVPAAAAWQRAIVTGPAVDVAIAVLSAVLTLLGYLQARRGPRVRTVTIGVPGLPRDLDGFTVAQISDLHIGPTLRRAYLEDVVRRTNALRPDVVAVTGDLADADASVIAPHLAPLSALSSRFGTYFATGNHEYYWDTAGLLSCAGGLGLRPLINENRVLEVGETRVLVAGVTDPMGANHDPSHVPDVARAARTEARAAFRILLAHRPNVCDEAEKAGFDLQLSGHTHGGQFFPFNVLVPLVHRYARGLHRQGRLAIYVNRGTGFWGPQDRLGVSSEITLIKLAGLAEKARN